MEIKKGEYYSSEYDDIVKITDIIDDIIYYIILDKGNAGWDSTLHVGHTVIWEKKWFLEGFTNHLKGYNTKLYKTINKG